MPRIRQLKPSFFLDEDLAECSPWARLLFQGLWTLADRKGRLEDRPNRIQVQVFPYDHLESHRVTVIGLLNELEAPRKHGPGGFIRRYTVNGRAYIQVVNFLKHQKVHPKEAPSEIPDAPTVVSIAAKKRGSPGKNTAKHGKEVAGIPASGEWVLENGERNLENGVTPADAGDPSQAVVVVVPPWTERGGTVYEAKNGLGTWDKRRAIRFNTVVAPLVKNYGDERVMPVWEWYINRPGEKPGFVTPEAFAANFLQWEEQMRGGTALAIRSPHLAVKPTAGERTIDVVNRAIDRHSGKERAG